MFRPVLILSLFASLFFYRPEFAFSKPELKVSLSASQLKSGQTGTLSLHLDWPIQEAQYGFIVPTLKVQNLTLQRQGESRESFLSEGEPWTRKTFTFEFSGSQKGEALIEGFRISYMDPVKQMGGSLEVPAQKLIILPAPAPFRDVFLGGIFGFSALILLVAWYFFKKYSRSGTSDFVTEETLEEKLRQRIQGFRGASSKSDHHHDLHELAQSFKQFLATYYRIEFVNPTESELGENLKSNKELDRRDRENIVSILNQIDQAKYGSVNISEADWKNLQRDIQAFVDSKRVIINS